MIERLYFMIKQLPIAEPPKLSHQFLALPLSIIMTNENMWGWYYSEFIQMYTHRDLDDNIFVRTYNNLFLERYDPLECIQISPFKLKLGKDIIEFFKMMINNQYYIYTFCDKFYIKILNINHHMNHDILIYGYDDNLKSFKAYVYKGNWLDKVNITYDEFILSYNSDFFEDNFTMLYRKKDRNFDINLEKIKWHLLDYIEGVNTFNRECANERPQLSTKWGVDVYDEMLKMYKRNFENNDSFNIAETYCFYEHKKDMLDRVVFLNESSPIKCTDEIIGNLKLIKEESLVVVNKLLKCKLTGFNDTSNTLNSITKYFNKMKVLEFDVLNLYYKNNKNVFEEI